MKNIAVVCTYTNESWNPKSVLLNQVKAISHTYSGRNIA